MTVKVRFRVEHDDLVEEGLMEEDGIGSPLQDWDNRDRVYEMPLVPRIGDSLAIEGVIDGCEEPDLDFIVTNVHHHIYDGVYSFTSVGVKKYRAGGQHEGE
tara:strand:+ start:3717 stop:4019 length:303 start_codon:yes stop_codon:yes gene_type:complete